MRAPFVPADEPVRERVRRELGTSFVLEAGAGTGKTTLLVERLLALVTGGAARLDQVAAVTFTENAATTLKLRLQERLERVRATAETVERERASVALEALGRAQVSTIHALCRALLSERPLECGVPPGFRGADEAEADLLFAEAWEEWLAERLAGGDAVLLEALEAGIPFEGERAPYDRASLRGLAKALVRNRDLRPLCAEGEPDARVWREELSAKAERARTLAGSAAEGDTMRDQLLGLVEFAEKAQRLESEALLAHMRGLRRLNPRLGRRDWWPSAAALDEARGLAEWTAHIQKVWQAESGTALHGRLVRALAGVGRLYEAKKVARGVLDFEDLLLRARDALFGSEAVRSYFHRRFRHVLVDEFQDTDPLQVEVATLLAGEAAGGLVVVGDAKQSIYRFRRAEVRVFRRAAETASRREGWARLSLTQNFRSRGSIVRFVNRAFAALIEASEETGQPAYEPIAPPPGLPEDASVVALDFAAAPLAEGDELVRREAAALAAWIAEAARGRFTVRDAVDGAPRPSRAGDVMVLSRRLTKVPLLEEALESAGLRFTVQGGKSFFDRQEVHETLAVLRAVEDPSDRVCLVAALRSSFFGVSDRDLVSYALAGGRLALGPVQDGLPGAGALASALRLLGELRSRRSRESVAALLDRLFEETRIAAALTGTRRGEAAIANLEKVAALARQAETLDVLTLHGFIAFLQERLAAAPEEPDLPSTRPGDPQAVRVLSIHKAKGLEAPIVALFDSADDGVGPVDVVASWDEKAIAIGFRQGFRPPGWDALEKDEKARAAAELRRLLYVACTRPRDLLVVPRPPRDAQAGAFWRAVTVHLPAASDQDVRVVDAETLPAPPAEPATVDLRALAGAAGADALGQRWEQERATLLRGAASMPFVPSSATAVAARTAPAALHAPGGEGGRDFGGLVHRILEWIPLDATADRVTSMAAGLAPIFGLDARGTEAAAEAVSRVLSLPLLQRARRAARHWRELPVWFPDGSDLVEGVVDLVFEEDGGLVVVDYKTDHLTEAQVLGQAAHHAPQLRLYARAVTAATSQPVKERLVLFAGLGTAVSV